MTPVTTVSKAQTITDLKSVSALISERGWGRDAWCAYDSVSLAFTDKDFCLGGAMAYALSGGRIHSPNFLPFEDQGRLAAMIEALNLPAVPSRSPSLSPDGIDRVIEWNDRQATVQAVLARLEGTVARLEAEK